MPGKEKTLKFLQIALVALVAFAPLARAEDLVELDMESLCRVLIDASVAQYRDEAPKGVSLKEWVWAAMPADGCDRPDLPNQLTDAQLGLVNGKIPSAPVLYDDDVIASSNIENELLEAQLRASVFETPPAAQPARQGRSSSAR